MANDHNEMSTLSPSAEYPGSQDNHSEILTIIKGAGILSIGAIIGSGLRYVLQIIIARNLESHLFGLFFLGLTVFRTAEKISEFGLSNGVVRYVAIFQGLKDYQRVKGIILLSLKTVFITGPVLGALVYFLSKELAIHLFHKPELTPILKVFAILIPFSNFTTMLVFSIQGLKAMRYKVYVSEYFEPLLSVVCVAIVFYVLGWKLYGALSAYIVPLFFAPILAFSFLKKIFPEITLRDVKPISESGKLFNFSWPLLFIYFASVSVLWMDILMLGYFRPSEEVGIYSSAQRTAMLGVMFSASFNAIFAPIISDLYHRGELLRLHNVFKTVTKWTFTLNFPVYLLLIFYAKPILSIFGPQFLPGEKCLIILSIGFLIHAAAGPVGLMVTMTGRSKLQLLNASLSFSLAIVLTFFMVSKWGMPGAATATAISIALINVINGIEVAILLRMYPFRLDFFKPIMAGGAAFLVLYLLRECLFQKHAHFLSYGGVFVFFMIYILVIFLLGIEEEDRVVLNKLKNRFLLPR